MEPSREEILELLSALSIILPPKTKLPDDALNTRLIKALDSTQNIAKVLGSSSTINPSTLSKWPRTKKLLDGVRRHNVQEAMMVSNAETGLGPKDPFPLYANPFMDARQTLMSIGNLWDNRVTAALMQNQEGTSGIAFRIVDTVKFDDHTPVIVVLYRHSVIDDPAAAFESIQWMQSQVDKGRTLSTGQAGIHQITASTQEQRLLLRLLQSNSKRLAPSYKPKRDSVLEKNCTLSFLLPVGPLSAKDLGAYCKNDGCNVCGDPGKMQCSRCHTIRYCSAECQKYDWKSHKPLCTSLKGATWVTLKFKLQTQDGKPLYAVAINRFSNVQESRHDHDELLDRQAKGLPPVNSHGSSPFIVKVQVDAAGISMLIYDRRRSFEAQILREQGAWMKVTEKVREKGWNGLKLFCWAIRRSDWEVDICVDAFPEWQQW